MKKENKEQTKTEFNYRMNLVFEVMKKRLIGKIPKGLLDKSTLEEQDSILKGLIEANK